MTKVTKVEPRVLSATAGGQSTPFIILLADQAEVSAAYDVQDQDAHASYVYQILKDIVRYAGAGYLIYLGVCLLIQRSVTKTQGELPRAAPLTIFREVVVTNVLNPKVALFFLAFLPLFASPTHGSVGWQITVLGLYFDFSGTLVNLVAASTPLRSPSDNQTTTRLIAQFLYSLQNACRNILIRSGLIPLWRACSC